MKIENLAQHCGECDVMEYCGNPFGFCLCSDRRFWNMEESEYKRIAETATDMKKLKACEGCTRPDCGPYKYSDNDNKEEACEHDDDARDFCCEQIADYVWSNLPGGAK